MSLATVSDVGAEWLDLERSFNGPWIIRAKLDLGDNDALPLGQTSCVFDDGSSRIEYVGTIIESSNDVGDGYVVIVGGMGNLGTLLPGIDYAQPQARTVAKDIIAACGEIEGDLSGLESIARIEPSYSCLSGSASLQLDKLCALIGARWYTRADGAIDVGVAQWPTYSGDAFITNKANQSGVIKAEPSIPDIEPCSVVDGNRIAHVRYYVIDDGLTAMLVLEQP